MKKRILSMLLVIVMVLSMVPLQALAEEPGAEGSITAPAATLEVTRPNGKNTAKVGVTLRLNATMSDGSAVGTVDWKSSDDALVKLTPKANGVCSVQTLAAGDVTITATANGQSQIFALKITEAAATAETSEAQAVQDIPTTYSSNTVPIAVEGNAVNLAVGESVALTVKPGAFTTLKNVKWIAESASGTSGKVTISNERVSGSGKDTTYTCQVTGDQVGEVKISFSGSSGILGTVYSGNCTLKVVAASKPEPAREFDINAGTGSVYVGKTLQLSATENGEPLENVTWESSDETKATVGKSTGLLTGVSAGEVTVTAKRSGYNDQTVTITVKQNSITIKNADGSAISGIPSVPAGDQLELAALDAEGDPVSDATWTSNPTSVATVENGVVTGVAAGDVEITVGKTGYGTDSQTVTVEAPKTFGNIKLKDDGTSRPKKLAVNETRELVAMFGGKAVDGVEWELVEGTAAELTGNELTGVSTGKVTVAAKKAGFATKTATINVVNEPIDTIVVTGYPTSMFAGEELDLAGLKIDFYPEYASDKTITWETNKPDVAKVENGKLCALKAGEVVLTARFSNGSTHDMPTLTVKPATKIVLDSKLPTTLLAGETLKLNDYTKVVDARTGKVQTNAVNWEIVEQQEGITLANNVLSSRSDITLSHVVTLKATAVGCDAVEVQKTITVYPKTSSLTLSVGGDKINGETYTLNLLDDAADAGVTIQASILPANAQQDVHWVVTGDVSICTKTEAGNTLTLIPTATKQTGDITVKAVALDGTDKSATATISFANLGMAAEIDVPEKIRGGASATLTANIKSDSALSDSTVTWSFADGSNTIKVDGKKVATINKTSGKLTTKVVTAPTTVTVKATIAATGKSFTKNITIYPAVKTITVTGAERTIEYNKANRTLKLSATVLPAAADVWDLNWSSSDESVATVNKKGKVTILDAGKVRITCEATDGSKVKGYLYLEITKDAGYVTITAPSDSLVSGDSMDMKAEVWTNSDVKAANQNVIWSVEDEYGEETSAATISATGRVMAGYVDQTTTVKVIATSVEDEDAFGVYELTIVPTSDKILYVEVDGELVNGFYTINHHDTYALNGMWLMGNGTKKPAQDCTFSSDDEDVAFVDEDGILEAVGHGIATITADCVDPDTGNRYLTYFDVEVTDMVSMVTIDAPDDRYLRGGETAELYAEAWTYYGEYDYAENQNFDWEVYEVVGTTLKETEIAYIDSDGVLYAADTVDDLYHVRVKAVSQENGISASVDFYICPEDEYKLIFELDGREYADIMSVDRNTNLNYNRITNPTGLIVYALVAIENADGTIKVSKPDVTSSVYWDSSYEDVIAVGTDGKGLTIKDIGSTELTAYYYYGTDYKKYVAESIIVYVNQTVGSITIEQTGILVSGKSTNMRAVPKNSDATNQNVLWSVEGPNADKVTINAYTGLLKAKSGITSKITVTVKAEPVDGSAGATKLVTIYPLTTNVDIKSGSTTVTGTTVTFKLSEKTASFTAVATPGDAYQGAFKWTSSNEYVAEVDPDTGVVTFNGTGTVTIKATAQDGTSKVGKVRLRITN